MEQTYYVGLKICNYCTVYMNDMIDELKDVLNKHDPYRNK